jgi:hypothetical protein
MLANPTAVSFIKREGTSWLEQLRSIRLITPIKRTKGTSFKNKDDAFMKRILAQMNPEQMKGYLKGLTK